MSTVAEIEKAITELPFEQSQELARWLLAYLEDLEDGLAAERAEAQGGPRVSLDEVKREFGLK